MKIDEIKKMLSEISPWPWNVVLYEHGFSAALIDSKVECNDSKYYVVTGSGYEINLKDANFIAAAPEIISELIKQNELMRKALEEISNVGPVPHNPKDKIEDAYRKTYYARENLILQAELAIEAIGEKSGRIN